MSAAGFGSKKAARVAGRYGIDISTIRERGEPQAVEGYTVDDVQHAVWGYKWRWEGAERVKIERNESWETAGPGLRTTAPRVVFAPGVFDLLHAGHVNLLWRAKQLGDVLVVGVVSDSGAHAYKGRFPCDNSQLRIQRVERLGFVDVVELQHTTDPTPLLERFRPKVLVHGNDWKQLLQGQETLTRLGIEFVTLPYTPGVSTTLLREVG